MAQTHYSTDKHVFAHLEPVRESLWSPFRAARAGSLLLLTVTAVLVLYTAPVQVDIVATVIGYSLLAGALLLIATNFVVGRLLRTRIETLVLGPPTSREVHAPSTESAQPNVIESLTPTEFLVALKNSPIPPLFYLRVRLIFGEESPLEIEYLVSGFSHKERYLSSEVTFPFRGHWECQKVEFSLHDQFGFTRSRWQRLPVGKGESVVVLPRRVSFGGFPFVSSMKRAGDELPDFEARMGDPLEIKPYHPSDGLRRIVWKHFAKSGELVSRHPEPSMSPEGQLVLFVIAGELDDDCCDRVLQYLRAGERAGLELALSCCGRGTQRPVKSWEAMQDELVSSVWRTRELNAHNLASELRAFCSNLPGVAQILLCLGPSFFETRHASSTLSVLGTTLSELGIGAHILLDRDASQAALENEAYGIAEGLGWECTMEYPENEASWSSRFEASGSARSELRTLIGDREVSGGGARL